jgi:hypothetical protein
MIVVDSAQERLVELATYARVTVPAKAFTESTVMVEVPELPALTIVLVGLAEIVKSWT